MIDRSVTLQLLRHSWLPAWAEQVRQFRLQDEANGIYWNTTRDGGGEPKAASGEYHGH